MDTNIGQHLRLLLPNVYFIGHLFRCALVDLSPTKRSIQGPDILPQTAVRGFRVPKMDYFLLERHFRVFSRKMVTGHQGDIGSICPLGLHQRRSAFCRISAFSVIYSFGFCSPVQRDIVLFLSQTFDRMKIEQGGTPPPSSSPPSPVKGLDFGQQRSPLGPQPYCNGFQVSHQIHLFFSFL